MQVMGHTIATDRAMSIEFLPEHFREGDKP
jgi:hypothetical protein